MPNDDRTTRLINGMDEFEKDVGRFLSGLPEQEKKEVAAEQESSLRQRLLAEAANRRDVHRFAEGI